MVIYFIVFAVIVMPLITPQKYKNKALMVSFFILFVLFGLQYEMTHDWPVYIGRWVEATEGKVSGARKIEVVYAFLMKMCQPLRFFGYLMVCAAFNLCVFYKYYKKYVPIEWVWLGLAVFMLRTNFAFTYIDTNRQTLAITFTMLALYWMIFPIAWKKNKYIIPAILFLCAVNIHTSAIIALPVMIFPIICKHINTNKYLYVFIGIYFFSYFVNFDSISNMVSIYMEGESTLEGFSQYAVEISERSKSIPEQSIYAILLFLLIHYFMKFEENIRPLVLAYIIFISLQGYVMYTMMRALFYYQVYAIYVIPVLFCILFCEKKRRNLKVVFLLLFIAYCLFSFNKEIGNPILEEWLDFTTVFSADKWM